MSSPRVGIVLPCYNEEQWIAGAIDCVLDQSYENFELVVVDDGSTDDTGAIVQEFDDPRVRYVPQTNRGDAGARNKGLDSLETEFYAFIDADDRWHPNKLQRQIEVLDSTDAKLVHANARYIDADGKELGKHHDEPPTTAEDRHQFLRSLFLNNVICTSSVVCHHSAIDEKRFDEDLYANSDHDMWLRVAENHRITYVDEILLQYRIHDGNISKNYENLFEDRKAVTETFSQRNESVEDLVNQKLSDIYLTYGINLALDGRSKEARPVLRQALRYDWTNWKIYGAYPLTYVGYRLLKSVSKAGQNY
jgi:glycosyltransferase involved in cell wall biosynthesis